MILVTKFLESHLLSLQDIPILMIVAFVWLNAWALGEIILKLTYEYFQDEVYEDFKIKCTRSLIFSFQSNETSVLEHIAPIYFPIYSIDVVLHAWVNECAPMIELTKLVLSFSWSLRSIWVVVIWLELLSLAWPGLGLGNGYVTSFILAVT
jgi:hypothetical protein